MILKGVKHSRHSSKISWPSLRPRRGQTWHVLRRETFGSGQQHRFLLALRARPARLPELWDRRRAFAHGSHNQSSWQRDSATRSSLWTTISMLQRASPAISMSRSCRYAASAGGCCATWSAALLRCAGCDRISCSPIIGEQSNGRRPAGSQRYPRHVHLEAGFGRGEADLQIPRRVLFRRWALARCALIVVPSRRLEDLACRVWRLPAARVAYVPNGVDTARFSPPSSRLACPA